MRGASTKGCAAWLSNHADLHSRTAYIRDLIAQPHSFVFFEAHLGAVDEQAKIGLLQEAALKAIVDYRVPCGVLIKATRDLESRYLKSDEVRSRVRLVLSRENADLSERLSGSSYFPSLVENGLVMHDDVRKLGNEAFDRVEAFFAQTRMCA